MRYYTFLVSTLISSAVLATSLPTDVKISVFTTQNYSIQHTELATHLYYLDAVENLEENATQFLSEKIELAEQQAKKWLSSSEGKKFEQQLQQAYTGITEGWKHGVMKVPAILFQSQGKEDAVIYGQTDVAKAIQTYQKSEVQ